MTHPNRVSLRIALVFLVMAFLWTLFSNLLAPPLIKSAYRGESITILNYLVTGRETHSVQEYLTSWERIDWFVLTSVLVSGLGFLLINRPTISTFLTTHLTTSRITLIWGIFLLSVMTASVWDLSGHWQKKTGWEPVWIAHSLAKGEGFSFPANHRWLFSNDHESDQYFPTAWAPPVYPALMAAFFYAFGEDGRLPILVFQIMALTGTAIVLFFLGRMAFNFWTGLLAGSLWMVLPQAQAQSVSSLNSAPIGGLMVSLSACMLVWCLRDVSVNRGLLLGLVVGFTALTHSGTLLFLPISILLLLWLARPLTSVVWKTALVMVIACGMIIGPWALRNMLVFEEIVPLRNGGGYNMYLANPILAETFSSDFDACSNPPSRNAKDALDATLQTKKSSVRYVLYQRAYECMRENVPEGYEGFNEAKRDKAFMKKAKDFIFSEPLTFIHMTSQKSLAFFFVGWPRHQQIISLLAFISLIIMIRRQETRMLTLLTLAWAVPYSLGFPCVYRYRYPIEPMLLLLASAGVIFSGEKLNGLFRRKLVGTQEHVKG